MGIIIDDDGVIHKVFTKDEVVAILTDIWLEIEELKNKPHCCEHYVRGINNSSNVIQQKINTLKRRRKVMTREEILNIVNEPSKHIHIVKIDGEDSIVYSSKFVELLELIPTMLTKADMMDMLKEMRAEIEHVEPHDMGEIIILNACKQVVDTRINSLKENEDGSNR